MRRRVNSKGQVTIPADIRKKAGLAPGTEVEITFEGADVIVRRPWQPPDKQWINEWLERIRGSATSGLSTDEIMRLTRGED